LYGAAGAVPLKRDSPTRWVRSRYILDTSLHESRKMTRRTLSLFLATAVVTACEPAPAADFGGGAAPEETAEAKENATPSGPEDFAGKWEVVSDDGTYIETAEMEVSGQEVTGIVRSLERGYYSGRVTVKAEAALRGTPRAGGLDLVVWDVATGSPDNGVKGRALRRGEYLILQIGHNETGYARPGVSVVQTAEGSAAASKLAEQIAGRIYSASTGGSGRGAFVGSRARLALCADGSIAFDVSDLATTGGSDGVDMGSSTSRRGQWGIVLLAGAPVVQARWTGTGSSYSLTRYFRIEPTASGARIDGSDLPLTGRC
jgi:hypothetical protein